MAGQVPEAWSNATFREAQVIIEAASLRDARLAWQAAQYHRYAVHQPNDMPEEPSLDRQEEVSSAADRVEAKAWMRAMSRRAANGS